MTVRTHLDALAADLTTVAGHLDQAVDAAGQDAKTIADLHTWYKAVIAGKDRLLAAISGDTTPAPDPEPTPVPSKVEDPVAPAPPADGTGGLLISHANLLRLPTTGPAWDNVNTAARGGWGDPTPNDNNSLHDTSVLAGALVAARTGDGQMTSKTVWHLALAVRAQWSNRALEASRNITSYVLAADILRDAGLYPAAQDAEFRSFIAALRYQSLQGHSGADSIAENALSNGTNWAGMSRAAMAAINLYLGDLDDLAALVDTHTAWLGEPRPHGMRWSDTTWHADPARKVGVNRRGATIGGRSVDGVIPEDQRRTGGFTWPAPRGSYPWEALQGATLASALLHRAGLLDFRAGDDALVRAAAWLTNVNGNPAGGDDRNTPAILNRFGGTSYRLDPGASPAKNVGWLTWLFGDAK